ncbi:hypothetical protein JJD66_27735 [Pseudomonas sp. MF6751]|uniref:hypothetical protein n=1 Tax=Pseudomonas sp. MF6751 TaxID=2797528 RepID=UPI00190959EE|nr:hypothetical protein [Pseudomonas sp. MF6751]MBK3479878.1 hypothetical protein [Pseudomonas sp. MF6751]
MDESLPIITKRVNSDGMVECHLGFSSDWDGFDSIVKYLKKYWQASPVQTADNIYSRRWVLICNGVMLTVYHDSQIGNYLIVENGEDKDNLLGQIEADLIERFR